MSREIQMKLDEYDIPVLLMGLTVLSTVLTESTAAVRKAVIAELEKTPDDGERDRAVATFHDFLTADPDSLLADVKRLSRTLTESLGDAP